MHAEGEIENQLREEVARLKAQLGAQNSLQTSIEGLDLLALRLAADGVILYANSAFVRYCQAEKEDLIGHPVSILAPLLGREIYEALMGDCLESQQPSFFARDEEGRVFEMKMTLREGTRDVVLQDVTDQQRFHAYVRKYLPADFNKLSEADQRSFKFPERRFMSVSFTDLRGFTALSESLMPEEVRSIVNAFLDEVVQAIEGAGGVVDKFVGDEVMALYGAPIYYQDHIWRAIRCACDQVDRVEKLREELAKAGKTLPPCGVGLNTGDMVLGNMGSSTRQSYTVLGSAVNLASRLCGAADGGEVLISESMFKLACEQLPEGWKVKAFSEKEFPAHRKEKKRRSLYGSLSARSGKIDEVLALPEDLMGKVIGVGSNENAPTILFRYRYVLRIKGMERLIVVMSVEQSKKIDIPLNEARVEPKTQERILGKYRLIEIVGRGGMGEVWKARDQFGNQVAIKTLLSGEAATESQIKRFHREAEVMSRLNHRNICRIFEVGEWEKLHYIAMEFVDGVSLHDVLGTKGLSSEASHSDWSASSSGTDDSAVVALSSLVQEVREAISISEVREKEGGGLIPVNGDQEKISSQKRGRLLPVQQAIYFMQRIGEAVQVAHEQGVLHRDLKPANILLRENGEPVVMDFGLAKVFDEKGVGGLSLSGQVIGTLDYMAPEQARSQQHLDERADVYSLGAIFFQMLTGKKCFVSTGNLLADSRRLESFEPSKPSEWNGKLDSDLDAILLMVLASNPTYRYRSVAAFLDDLDHYQKGQVIAAKTPNSFEILWKLVRRNAAVSITIAIAAVLFVLLAGYAFRSISQERDRAEAAAKVAQQERDRAVSSQQIASLQRKAAEARNLLDRQPQQGLALVEQAAKESLESLGSILPAVQFSLGQAMQAAREQWRVRLGKDSVICAFAIKGNKKEQVRAALVDRWYDVDREGWMPDDPFLLKHPMTAQAASLDGSFLVMGDSQSDLWLWPAQEEEPQFLFNEKEGEITALAVSDLGNFIAWGSSSGKIHLGQVEEVPQEGWKLVSEEVFPVPDELSIVGIALDRRKQRVFAIVRGLEEDFLIGWNWQNPHKPHFIRPLASRVFALAFRPYPFLLALGNEDGAVRLFDGSGNPVSRALRGHDDAITALAFHPDGTRLVSGSLDRKIWVWGSGGEYMGEPFIGHQGGITSLRWSLDGQALISASEDGTVRTWDMRELQSRPSVPADPSVERLIPLESVSQDGQRLICADLVSNQMVMKDLSSGEETPLFELPVHPLMIELSPDENILAMSGEDHLIYLYQLDRLQEAPKVLYGHWGKVFALAFDPQSLYLASAGEDRSVMIWDLQGNLLSPPILLHTQPITHLEFSPDGREIITQSLDGTSRILSATPEGWLNLLKERQSCRK